MTLKNLLTFLAGFFIGTGVFQFAWTKINKKGYVLKQEEREKEGLPRQSYFEFCCEYYDSFPWKLRKALGINWFYNSKLFDWYIKLRGILLIALGLVLIVIIIALSQSESGAYLDLSL